MGAAMVVLPSVSFDAGALLDVVERERVTSTFLVPTQWQAVCDEQERAPRDLSRLWVSSWGAAPASDTLLRKMGEVLPGASCVALFGQTEMSLVTCVLEAKDALRKLGSVGRPVPGVWARIVDPDMVDVQPGEVGENIYCAEVENALAGHPDIAEVAVIGRAHERWGETPVAVVSLKPGAADLTIGELRAWAGERLARYKLPTELVVVDVLPSPRTCCVPLPLPYLRDRKGSCTSESSAVPDRVCRQRASDPAAAGRSSQYPADRGERVPLGGLVDCAPAAGDAPVSRFRSSGRRLTGL